MNTDDMLADFTKSLQELSATIYTSAHDYKGHTGSADLATSALMASRGDSGALERLAYHQAGTTARRHKRH